MGICGLLGSEAMFISDPQVGISSWRLLLKIENQCRIDTKLEFRKSGTASTGKYVCFFRA